MGLVKFLLGKRLLEDDLQRGLNAWASTPKVTERRLRKLWPKWISEATAALESPGVRWTRAGEVSVARSGQLAHPELPVSSGVVRVDLSGPGFMDYAVMLSTHENMRSNESDWEADPELTAQLRSGAHFVVHFVVTDHPARLSQQVETDAEASGYWLLHRSGEGNVLMANTGYDS